MYRFKYTCLFDSLVLPNVCLVTFVEVSDLSWFPLPSYTTINRVESQTPSRSPPPYQDLRSLLSWSRLLLLTVSPSKVELRQLLKGYLVLRDTQQLTGKEDDLQKFKSDLPVMVSNPSPVLQTVRRSYKTGTVPGSHVYSLSVLHKHRH